MKRWVFCAEKGSPDIVEITRIQRTTGAQYRTKTRNDGAGVSADIGYGTHGGER